MKIVVTGGAGFIGSNLVGLALEGGHSVSVVDDLSTGYRENLAGMDVELVEASVNDHVALDEALERADSIVHLGALGSVPRSIQDPFSSHLANASGTLSVLEGARRNRVDHVISASSSSVYGMNPAMPKNEREWVRPMSPYAVTKLATEQYTLAYQQSFGLKTLAFRFFNVYGPGQRPGHAYAAVIPVFAEAILNGNPLPINGDGSNSRDFTFVGTVCRVLLDAAERTVSHPEPVNLAFGTNTNLLELISVLEDASSLKATLQHREPRPGDVPHSQASNTALMRLFPDVEPVLLEDGVRQTVEWLRDWRNGQGFEGRSR